MSDEEIEKFLEWHVAQQGIVRANAAKISWYMRGGLSYTDALNMSSSEIDNINALIDDNLETTKKSGLPFF
jgi:hypothetical protein